MLFSKFFPIFSRLTAAFSIDKEAFSRAETALLFNEESGFAKTGPPCMKSMEIKIMNAEIKMKSKG
jgi:hypothetical protein